MSKVIEKIARKFTKLRLRPIRVFVFHQVSDTFDPDSMWECDWTNTEVFKRKIISLIERGYSFISLSEATKHLKKDCIRWKKFAVLTSDDGNASLCNIIPWLVETDIPITLFVNPLYMVDGLHNCCRDTEKFFTENEIIKQINDSHSLITIASHGWDHRNSQELSINEFISSCDKVEKFLQKVPNKIPYFAFTYGKYLESELNYLQSIAITPVLCDGLKNYADSSVIHRECLDEGYSI